MPKLYLVRHGKPQVPAEKTYYGVTDIPLSSKGFEESSMTAQWLLESHGPFAAVFTSPLARAIDTALTISKVFNLEDCIVCADLREIDLGAWEGVSFSEVRKRYPDEYEARGENPAQFETPGGESFRHAGRRFLAELRRLAAQVDNDIVVVAHAGVIKACLCELGSLEYSCLFDTSIPTASVTVLDYRGGSLSVGAIARLPESRLDDALIERLYERCDTPAHVIEHMRAVRDCCDELLGNMQHDFNVERVEKAALLHDVLRKEPNHAKAGARVVEVMGFHEIAGLIESHHDEVFDDETPLTEADVLWFADKLCRGSQRVTLEERFEASREKCKTEEALKHHANRFQKALSIQKKIEKSCIS